MQGEAIKEKYVASILAAGFGKAGIETLEERPYIAVGEGGRRLTSVVP
ncbi:hypothetical protein [Nitrososphaera sp.]